MSADWDDARIDALMRPEIPPALQAEALDVLRTWPTVWTAVDSETCSAVREDALSRLVRRGLLECRIRFGVAGKPEWLTEFCGTVMPEQIVAAMQKAVATDEQEATALEWSQVFEHPPKFRLSAQGQIAKDKLASTGESWVVTWIFWETMQGPAEQFVRVERANEPSSSSDCITNKGKDWWATTPPGDGWHDKPLIGTKKELAHCVGVALHGKPVDVKTLPKMHRKSVWIWRINETTWQAYFHKPEILAAANAAQIKLREGVGKGAEGSEGEPKG